MFPEGLLTNYIGMNNSPKITKITAREIIDSRSKPTLEVDVILDDSVLGRASAPSGASTGKKEAKELRDHDPKRYNGLGTLSAISKIDSIIAPELIGRQNIDQNQLDDILIDLDGTKDKSNLGANGILAISLAFAHATAKFKGTPLYRDLTAETDYQLPVPMFNLINGGRHALNSTDIQEFMLIPARFESFSQSVRAGVEIYHSLHELIIRGGHHSAVGDEGGFAPTLDRNQAALTLLVQAIYNAGYSPGKDCFIALDVAASELTSDTGITYHLKSENETLTASDMINLYRSWIKDYPIISIEDGLVEDDWDNWTKLTEHLGNQIQIVGDDLFTTNVVNIENGINYKAANAVLIKPNQVGTLTETIQAIQISKQAGWRNVISHRSGETEDTTIADLAVGTSAGQIKAGAPARSERTAKYNRLIRIEQELGSKAIFPGLDAYF